MKGTASSVMRVALVAVSVVACGARSPSATGSTNAGDGGSDDAAGTQQFGPWLSGSRLRARIWEGGDAARLFVGWWDQKLGIPCTFRLADDQRVRCLPELEQGAMYAGDDCWTPTYVSPDPSLAAGSYVRFARPPPASHMPNPMCGQTCVTTELPSIAARVGEPTSLLRASFNGGDCGCTSFDVAPSQVFRTLQIVPPEEFVAAEVHLVGDSLAARVIEAEDGSLEVPSFVDPTTHSPCQLASTELDGAPDVCLSTLQTVERRDLYSSPDCTKPVIPIGTAQLRR